jgi:hypothetical protein
MLVLSLFIAVVCFQAVFAEFIRMEPSVNTFSSKFWNHEGKLGDDEVVKATFALKHNPAAREAFEKTFFEVSTPSHPRYGKFLTVNFLQIYFPMQNNFFFPVMNSTTKLLAAFLLLPIRSRLLLIS